MNNNNQSGHRQLLVRRMLSNRSGWIAAAALTAVIGLSGCAATSAATTAATPSATATATSAAGHGRPGSSGSGSNARSGSAEGGSSGTVSDVTSSGFTLTTSAGQKVTVKSGSSTTYLNGTSPTTGSAITAGMNVLALGTTNGTTITATQVTVQTTSPVSSTSYTASTPAPFKQGSPSAAKSDGQIPTDYTEGQGTIVSGSTADQAAEAALAAYPGGVVDRVVKLSDGEYEVHYIGVNWPHHIFVNTSFTVLGAN